MSLKAIIEAVVHLESFRNIELFYQGLYFLKCRLYSDQVIPEEEQVRIGNQNTAQQQKAQSNIQNAAPYCSFVSRVQMLKQAKIQQKGGINGQNYDHHNLLASKIIDEEQAFCSKVFLIRYCEEEVEINDIILFRAEVDVESDYLNTDFFLEIELHFSNLDKFGGSDQWQEIAGEIEDKVEFKKVQTQKFKIQSLAQGLTEFLPVNFQDQYFSILNCYIQSVLLDYRFRIKSYQQIHDEYFANEKKPEEKINIKEKTQIQQIKPETITHYFFADEIGNLPTQLDLREVDLIYNDYIRVMTIMFEKLKNVYNKFVNRFLNEEQKLENSIQPDSTRFTLGFEEESEQQQDIKRAQFKNLYKNIQEQSIINQNGKAVLVNVNDLNKEEEKNQENVQKNNMMMVMKHGDEDLVEDEQSIIHNSGVKSKVKSNTFNEQKEDLAINESTAEQKVTGSIPMLKNNKNALIRNSKPFSQRLKSGEINIDVTDIHAVANQMIFEINLLAGKTLILQHKLIEIMRLSPRFITDYLCLEYREKIRNQLNDSIFRNVVETTDFALPSEENIGESHKHFANTKRATKYINSNYGIRVFDMAYNKQIDQQNGQTTQNNAAKGRDASQQRGEDANAQKGDNQQLASEHEVTPIIFEECYVKNDDYRFVQQVKRSFEVTEQKITARNEMEGFDKINDYVGVHLFVLQHGFQGNSIDMRLLKNNLSILHPDGIFLSCQSNEEQTEGDILEMGQKLAEEVKSHIQQFCPITCLSRISFIGHSLGGLIIRAALPHLEEYKDKFYTYISLSSPHLGYMYNSNTLFNAGMWFLKKWRKSVSLTQLSMTDANNIEDTCLYKLSTLQGLNWFQNVVLVCSWQDQYAPFDSARIQICKHSESDKYQGEKYRQMAKNILSGLKTKMLFRLDVNFKIKDKNLDSWIGRTAHIQFLENQQFMKMLIYRYNDFFL